MTTVEYISSLTGFSLDEGVFQRIALDRGVCDRDPAFLDARMKDLLLADVLFAVWNAGTNIPSFQYQHGQFSTSTGSQTITDKAGLYDLMRRLYRRWGDPRADLFEGGGHVWME